MLFLQTVPLEEPDKNLLEKTYLQYRDTMYAVAFSVTQNSADAEDVVQEVFVKLAARYMSTVARLSSDDTLLYYLLTATRNTALNHYKKTGFRNEIPMDPDIIDSFRVADREFISRLSFDDTSDLSQMIRDLKPIYREVLYQRFVLELSVKEIADIDHLPTATIKKRLLRAKQLLWKKYKEKNHE